MTHRHPIAPAGDAAPIQRDGLLAALAAGMLALSWYGAAALDGYAIASREVQKVPLSAFDAAFISANAVDPGQSFCAQGCERLAQSSPSATPRL